LLSGKGKFYGIIDAFDTDPVLLHRDQFNRAGDVDFCLGLAKEIIHGKINNSLVLLRRQSRRQSSSELSKSVTGMTSIVQKMKSAQTLDELRGYEGFAARSYFQGIASVLDGDWRFSGRKK
ncbi:CRISPR-associated endonuclease Cas1, partial [Desulforhopalus vacuolatus]|uniref:CRISPR-associated endonuclease Cas1 n=1 Tax=Desulforhopalus vacuolatus TaxID=40414 RepID=UPI0019647BB1